MNPPTHSNSLWQRGIIAVCFSLYLCFSTAAPAWAFCGFFVARSETELTNTTSRVVIAHRENKSVFTMANNFQGDVKDFARIVPIPVLPTREQVRIGDNQIIEQLDAFTAPRLAEYQYDLVQKWSEEISTYSMIFVGLLCLAYLIWAIGWSSFRWWEKCILLFIVSLLIAIALPSFLNQANKAKGSEYRAAATMVQIADQFTVGEYDVTLLNATESKALTTWLNENGYKVPSNAEPMLKSYIQNGMKFFVVKVNLENLQQAKAEFLRPIVIEYESPKFMLPMRLGTLNATSDQDLTVYILSPNEVAEVANYPTKTVPSDAQSYQRELSGKEIPSWIKHNFGEFYQAVFQKAYEQAGKSVAFLEYAGAMSPKACDPCSMNLQEAGELMENLDKTGVFWSSDTYVSRLHIRYNATTFPQDLEFKTIGLEEMRSRLRSEHKLALNRTGVLFQARYVIRDPKGTPMGMSGLKYWWNDRKTTENLAQLTGWNKTEIQQKLTTNLPTSNEKI
jgi:hypothetical protein